MENNDKQSNILPLAIIFAVIVALIGGAYWFGKNGVTTESLEDISDVRDISDESDSRVVEDQDTVEESSGSESEATATENENEEDIDTDSNDYIVETVKSLLAEKYEKNIDEVSFDIDERVGDYLTGMVKFEDEISGGYVLAAKVDEEWKIVFDGNGNWTCEAVDEVDFPVSLAPDCWDDTNSVMVDRTVE